MADTRQEFFAQKPASQARYFTLEFYNSNAGMRRFVTGQQFPKSFQLESDAPRNAGQVVEFEPVGFDAPEPEQGDGGELALEIQLGAIGFEAKPYIDAVMNSWPPTLQVIYREHIEGITNPVGILMFEGEGWSIEEISVGLKCEQVNFAARDISIRYTSDVFRGLAGLI